mmetsp:Transcript_35212/g.88583  ORF Transcript_35212/g.88583 Transcript_35212/m.88583 type:complete len:216 (+) Transcript_35212:179-826(+)
MLTTHLTLSTWCSSASPSTPGPSSFSRRNITETALLWRLSLLKRRRCFQPLALYAPNTSVAWWMCSQRTKSLTPPNIKSAPRHTWQHLTRSALNWTARVLRTSTLQSLTLPTSTLCSQFHCLKRTAKTTTSCNSSPRIETPRLPSTCGSSRREICHLFCHSTCHQLCTSWVRVRLSRSSSGPTRISPHGRNSCQAKMTKRGRQSFEKTWQLRRSV